MSTHWSDPGDHEGHRPTPWPSRAVLGALRAVRRPLAWFVLSAGLVGFVLTFPLGIIAKAGDGEFWITLAGFFLLILDGYDKVIEVELDADDGPRG